jgi:desulfoferrodoxin (superoxide reductase-like protein)
MSTIKSVIERLNDFDKKLPVCYFDSKLNEYVEIEVDDGSIEKVWYENYQEWILSLNEDNKSLHYRFNLR